MSIFPDGPKKIKARIKSYERSLKMQGQRDGIGKRFLVGTLYLLVEDHKGALEYYSWYKEEFPGDCGDAFHFTAWTLALLRNGDHDDAKLKLQEAFIENPHIWDYLLGFELSRFNIWYSCNLAEPEYLIEAPSEYLKIWGEDDLNWVKAVIKSDEFISFKKEYLSYYEQLNHLDVGPERSRVVQNLSNMKHFLQVKVNKLKLV